jgi:site-specific DNA recombinase
MAKRITAIPATLNPFTSTPIAHQVKRKVAGYARVSTDMEEQLTSYENQVDYYTRYIQGHPDWEFVGIYTDEGITATNTKHREGFNRMIDDALAGRIGLIITKSVSRFARNTVDTLTTVRKLKEKGVEIFFEKENIWTLDSKGELLITIMSSLAQEESRSISENTTWGKRKTFADGKSSIAFTRFLGYDKDFQINGEEAKTVRLIYKLFLTGLSYYAITKELQRQHLPTPTGAKNWRISTVKSILTNEKYKGDALLQKGYTVDFLQKKRKRNEGEIPQYYVEGHHEPIIQPETFDRVQAEIQLRYGNGKKFSGVSIFANKIKCGECGGWYGAKVWHSNDKYKKVVYQCNHKYKDGCKCGTPHVSEKEIEDLFLAALDKLCDAKEKMIENLEILHHTVISTTGFEKEREALLNEVSELEKSLRSIISRNARIATNQADYEAEYNRILEAGDYKRKIARIEELTEEMSMAQSRGERIAFFIEQLENMKECPNAFDADLWGGIVESMTVFSKDNVVFNFVGNIEVAIG